MWVYFCLLGHIAVLPSIVRSGAGDYTLGKHFESQMSVLDYWELGFEKAHLYH